MTDNIEELREQTQTGSRIEQGPATDDVEIQEAIVAELDAIDGGEQSPNLTLRDKNITALVRALDEADQLDAVGAALDEALGNDPDESYNRADIGRLGIRIALSDVEPELLEDLEAAVAEQMQI